MTILNKINIHSNSNNIFNSMLYKKTDIKHHQSVYNKIMS